MNGKTVKALRAYLGMTQREFAESIGVSAISISNIERGITPVTDTMKMKISKVFQIDRDFVDTVERTREFDLLRY